MSQSAPDPAEPPPGAAETESSPSEPATPPPADAARSARTPGRAEGGAPAARTRTGNAFAGLLAGTVILILLLVFILENTQSVRVSYFGASGHLSLGIALLLAAVGGALLTGLTGLARVLQLRHRLRRR